MIGDVQGETPHFSRGIARNMKLAPGAWLLLAITLLRAGVRFSEVFGQATMVGIRNRIRNLLKQLLCHAEFVFFPNISIINVCSTPPPSPSKALDVQQRL